MSLRAKFRLLIAIFGISVAANVLVSVWCIDIYIANATSRFQLLMFSARDTENIRRMLDELQEELQDAVAASSTHGLSSRADCRPLNSRIANVAAGLGEGEGSARREQLVALSAHLAEAVERLRVMLQQGMSAEAGNLLTARIVPDYLIPLRRILADVGSDNDDNLMRTSSEIAAKQAKVTVILSVNAIAAFLLAAVGVHLVRNWVLKPVADLKLAVEAHSRGELRYRISEHAADELGTLSRAVNGMADSLLDIQERLVQQERLAAIGEVAATIAHNIRNPLAGIRASAQSAMLDLPEDGENCARQRQIMETVDSLNRWVRELLMVSQPILLQRQAVEVGELVDRVFTVMGADADRRGIRLKYSRSSTTSTVFVDSARIEQAILVVVANAVEASENGSEVEVAAVEDRASAGLVQLTVKDTGPEIDDDTIKRIGTPGFTTKPGGTGTGLYQAQRIVQAHGGNIVFENSADAGTRVTLRLPVGDDPCRRREGGENPDSR